MRIENQGPAAIRRAGRAAEEPGTVRSGAARAGGPADSVSLSTLSASLLVLAADSPVRQARVEGLERAVAESRYGVDPGETGRAVVREALGEARAA